MNCGEYERKRLKVKGYNFKDNQTTSQAKSRNYNTFTPLQERDLKCFNCHNYGHKERNCKLMEISEIPKILKSKRD